MSLEEKLKNAPKIPRKTKSKNRKKLRKEHIKIKKFANRLGRFVVHCGNTRCKVCGWQAFGCRLGCGKCDFGVGVVEWGAAISVGKINTAIGKPLKPLIEKSEFISYPKLLERMKNGDRFFCISAKRELTVKDFKENGK